MAKQLIGKNLRKLRQSMDYSQANMADMLGVSQSTIGMYENDQRVPPLETLMQYAEIFSITLDEVCGLEPPKITGNPQIQHNNEYEEDLLYIFRKLGRNERRELMAKAYELERKIGKENN